MHLNIDSLAQAYRSIVARVIEQGRVVAPRGQQTREVLGATIVLNDPARSLPVGTGRKLNPRIAAIEALQLISGLSYPELMVAASSNFARFMDGGAFHGAYGPRLRYQMPKVISALQADRDTRQAVATIWRPSDDGHGDVKDTPCTVSLIFAVREGRLNLHVNMRSNDVWLGLPYDFFQFTQLQIQVASVLGIAPGQYFHHAASLHIYERDVAAAEALDVPDSDVDDRRGGIICAGPEFIDPEPLPTWREVQIEAARLIDGRALGSSPAGEWYGGQMQAIRDSL